MASFPALGANDALTSTAERTQFRSTGRYPEVLQLCAAFERAYPRFVRCATFGRTPEGRPMVVLIASRTGTLLADEARRRRVPVALIQGGIHAGEVDGKDAGFIALREMLEGRAAKTALDKAVPVRAGDEALRRAGRDLRDAVIDDLAAAGSMPLAFYPSFVVADDPTSGFEDSVPPPRFSHGYFYLRNSLGMLVETHSWKDYATRVRITR